MKSLKSKHAPNIAAFERGEARLHLHGLIAQKAQHYTYPLAKSLQTLDLSGNHLTNFSELPVSSRLLLQDMKPGSVSPVFQAFLLEIRLFVAKYGCKSRPDTPYVDTLEVQRLYVDRC